MALVSIGFFLYPGGPWILWIPECGIRICHWRGLLRVAANHM
jgi:hypothetical protein